MGTPQPGVLRGTPQEEPPPPRTAGPPSAQADPASAPPSVAAPAAAAPATVAEALERELAESDAFWARVTRNGVYDTTEQLRDAVDRWDWREVETQKRAALEAARHPARSMDPSLGRRPGREGKQVNVKLGSPDFEALKALAVDRDVPASTMARILLRRAIHGAAGVPTR